MANAAILIVRPFPACRLDCDLSLGVLFQDALKSTEIRRKTERVLDVDLELRHQL